MKNILLFISITLIVFSCKKKEIIPEPILPPPTQEGANTFGCMINGEPWVAGFDCCVFTPSLRVFDVSFDEPGFGGSDFKRLSLIARKIDFTDSISSGFRFFIKPVFQEGILDYQMLREKEIYFTTSKADGLGNGIKYFYLDTIHPVNIDITSISHEENFLAGIFDFRMIHNNPPNPPDTLIITEGRFDVKYNPQ